MSRYLERRRDKQDNKYGHDETPVAVMETHDKIRSMIDITYTMKNGDTFSMYKVIIFAIINYSLIKG